MNVAGGHRREATAFSSNSDVVSDSTVANEAEEPSPLVTLV